MHVPLTMTGEAMQMMKRFAKISTAVLILAAMLTVGIAAGPGLVQDLTHAGGPIPSAPAGSLPLVVDWSLIIVQAGLLEEDQLHKIGGRARWAHGIVQLSSSGDGVIQ